MSRANDGVDEQKWEIACPHCSRVGRITSDLLGGQAVCVSCKKAFTVKLQQIFGAKKTSELFLQYAQGLTILYSVIMVLVNIISFTNFMIAPQNSPIVYYWPLIFFGTIIAFVLSVALCIVFSRIRRIPSSLSQLDVLLARIEQRLNDMETKQLAAVQRLLERDQVERKR